MATSLQPWTRLAARLAKRPPLRFVHGMRLALERGVCCAVHSHHEIEIVYHPTGRGTARPKGEPELDFRAGDVVVHPPRQLHDQVMATPGEDFCVQIALPSSLKKEALPNFRVSTIEDSPLIEDLRTLSRGRVQLDPAGQAILNLRATSALFSLIQLASMRDVSGTTHRSERYVVAAEKIIRENFASLRTLRDVAEGLGIGYDHLRHLFTAQRGRSLVHYLNEVRMERAKTLLVHTRLPLKQIATMCGFRDEYYFSAVFRRFVQVPPGKYRSRTR